MQTDPHALAEETLGLVKQLSRNRASRRGLLVRMSTLPGHKRVPDCYRDVAGCFHPYVRNNDGIVQRLPDGDMLAIVRRVSNDQFTSTFSRLASALRLDGATLPAAAILAGDRRAEHLIWLYDIDADYASFQADMTALCEDPAPYLAGANQQAAEDSNRLRSSEPADKRSVVAEVRRSVEQADAIADRIGARREPAKAEPAKQDATRDGARDAARRQREPAGLALLDQLAAKIGILDMERFISEQDVVAMIGAQPARPLMQLQWLDLKRVAAVAIPDRSLPDMPALRGYLGERGDVPLLRALRDRPAPNGLLQMVVIGLAATESEALDLLLTAHARRSGMPLVMAVRALDALSDPMRFLSARDKLASRRCKIALHGLDLVTAALVDIPALGADFLLLDYDDRQAEALRQGALNQVKARLQSMETAGLIMTGCDQPADIAFARSLGISLICGAAAAPDKLAQAV